MPHDTPVLTLAHSPDPDDAFMWWPLGDADRGVEPRIDTLGLRFRTVAEDIEALNRRAIEAGDLDISAMSFHAYAHCADRYVLTRCGASFGDGYGPKVVARDPLTVDDLRSGSVRATDPGSGGSVSATGGTQDTARRAVPPRTVPPRTVPPRTVPPGTVPRTVPPRTVPPRTASPITIAIPGERTSAYLTLRLMLGDAVPHTVAMPFHRIVEAVRTGEADAGVVIHEAQLTYADSGLHLVVDLGAWWHETTSLPMPLGANAIRRDVDARFGAGTIERAARVLRDSIAFAGANRSEGLAVAGGFAQPGTTAAQADRFVEMYVNDLTMDAGERGQRGVAELMRRGSDAGLIPRIGEIRMV